MKGSVDRARHTRPFGVPDADGGVQLLDLAVGRRACITALDLPRADELLVEGIRRGVEVEVVTRGAFGGPIVVSLGRARVALPRWVAARIGVRPLVDGPVDEDAAR